MTTPNQVINSTTPNVNAQKWDFSAIANMGNLFREVQFNNEPILFNFSRKIRRKIRGPNIRRKVRGPKIRIAKNRKSK